MASLLRPTRPVAHTPRPGTGEWDDLAKHLEDVGRLAGCFAEAFGARELGFLAGLWHDLGKLNPEFQDYLWACYRAEQQEMPAPRSRVHHAIWGAALAYSLIWKQLGHDEDWKEIALPIAAHHTGLHDGGKFAQELDAFLDKNVEVPKILARYVATLPASRMPSPARLAPTSRELYIRMIFSALVDADRLLTEKHFQPEQVAKRAGWPPLLGLSETLNRVLPEWMSGKPDSPVNSVRREVLDACREAALGPQGVFRLTVPTGGGKTLNGLVFAMGQARRHDLRRIVVAIPYTSIIDQTVEVYRAFLGEGSVLEHHSQIAISEDETQDSHQIRQRLATENWDAPVIVTTTVQLFESLFSNRASQVRKLHNLANSVILLDEVQTLPIELLEPTLDALRTLVEQYGVTLVLSTATQPALEASHYLKPFHGLRVNEIVPESDFLRHYRTLRRVDYEIWPGVISHEELAEAVHTLDQVMVVLNTRRDALAVIKALKDTSDVFHLSTLLCSAHRRKVLDEIKARLGDGGDGRPVRPVRLISTQVVEAGVDLDFPTVWRALGPLDRIVQAAGRCNREGKRPSGRVVVFELDGGGSAQGPYKVGIEEARVLLKRRGPESLHRPEVYREYFGNLFAILPVDGKKLQPERVRLNYPKVAKEYRLIEGNTVPVVVPYEESFRHLNDWRQRPNRANWQRLQAYLVTIYAHEADRLQEEGSPLLSVTEGLYQWLGEYDDERHLGLAQVVLDPSDLIWIG